MRNITKVFLLIVAAFLVYVIWPRTPTMKGFDPNELARLAVDDWKAQKAGKGTAALIARYKIYTSQFNLSPLSAFRMSQNQAAAVDELKGVSGMKSEGGENDDKILAIENKATSALTEKYVMIKIPATADGGADALAREEVAWIEQLLGGSPADEIAAPISRILAAEYGGAAEDFGDVSSNLAYAQWMIFSGQSTSSDGMSAMDYAREGFKLLKEVANTPPAEAPQN